MSSTTTPRRPRLPGAALAIALAVTACGGEDHLLGDGREQSGSGASAGLGGQAGTSAGCVEGEPVPSDLLASMPQANGFGRAATGGALGCLTRVTTLTDSGPGSLREALQSDAPAWIVFDVSGEIALASDINVRSNKTVDGRGSAITLREYGLRLAAQSNLVVENIAFVGNPELTGDAIQISLGAHTVFVDHCAFSSYGDGLVDVSLAATDVTVSYSHFFDHDKVMLLGAAPEDVDDVAIRVTLHHNWFEATGTYHPRLRFGWAHSYNNLFDRWRSWASGTSQGGELLSEANVFIADSHTQATLVEIAEDPEPGRLRSEADVPLNGAVILEREPELVRDPASEYDYVRETVDESFATRLQGEVGPR